jgi:hypothetical protein
LACALALIFPGILVNATKTEVIGLSEFGQLALTGVLIASWPWLHGLALELELAGVVVVVLRA